MKNFLLDLFFPKHCLGCGKEGCYLCPECLEKIPVNRDCPEKIGGIKLLSASFYEYPLLRRAIHKFKYEFVGELAEPLGQLMANKISESGLGQNAILLAAPLHPKRLRWRGFNQAELLAQNISQKLNIPLASGLLIRTKRNSPQMKIKTSQSRKENIKGAFALNPFAASVILGLDPRIQSSPRVIPASSCVIPARPQRFALRSGQAKAGIQAPIQSFSNKTLILIDDVSTSGATLQECAKALQPLNPKEIWGLVLARG